MIAVIEPDRRLARQLLGALQACGCRVRVAHGYAEALNLLDGEPPEALYLCENLKRSSGGDLLAAIDRDPRYATLPVLVRVSRSDSLFARAIRRGGLQTVVAPFDVDAAAERLVRMAAGEEGTLRQLVHQARRLQARTRANRVAAAIAIEATRRLRLVPRRP